MQVLLTEAQFTDAIRIGARQALAEFRDELSKDAAPPVMSKSQLANYLGRSTGTINRWMALESNPIPHSTPDGGQPLFYKDDVDRWMRGQK